MGFLALHHVQVVDLSFKIADLQKYLDLELDLILYKQENDLLQWISKVKGRSPTLENQLSRWCAKTPCNCTYRNNADLKVKMCCRDQNIIGHMPRSENEAQVLQYSPPNGLEPPSTKNEH